MKSKKVRHVLKAYEQSVSRSSENNNNNSSSRSIDDDVSSRNSNDEDTVSNEEDLISNLISSDDNDNRDVQEQLLQTIEDLNIKTVSTLIAKGYLNTAELGTRKLLRESNNSIDNEQETEGSSQFLHSILRTEPNTRERQDQLAFARNAGEFHRITMGGGILNCSDMMIGLARKRMKKDAESMEKEKKAIQAYEKNEKQARLNVFPKPYTKWTAKDFKIAIKYKQGLKAPDNRKWNQNTKLDLLRAFYEEHYKGRAKLGPDQIHWNEEDEGKLERTKAGEINSAQEFIMYGRCLEGRKNI